MNKLNKSGRPSKKQQIAIEKRDKEIVKMYEDNYPLDYIAGYFNISKGRIVQICNRNPGADKQ